MDLEAPSSEALGKAVLWDAPEREDKQVGVDLRLQVRGEEISKADVAVVGSRELEVVL